MIVLKQLLEWLRLVRSLCILAVDEIIWTSLIGTACLVRSFTKPDLQSNITHVSVGREYLYLLFRGR
ncbi:MAG: hypothetical protein DRR42_25700 [Gammaproteobacteria bacterium]|nr:MAG: hypothetical protein DRR42_25700 [Gammaproteobacteria bacterium]